MQQRKKNKLFSTCAPNSLAKPPKHIWTMAKIYPWLCSFIIACICFWVQNEYQIYMHKHLRKKNKTKKKNAHALARPPMLTHVRFWIRARIVCDISRCLMHEYFKQLLHAFVHEIKKYNVYKFECVLTQILDHLWVQKQPVWQSRNLHYKSQCRSLDRAPPKQPRHRQKPFLKPLSKDKTLQSTQ